MAEQQQEAPMKTYRGNCHCAAFVYEITLPEIKQATECNCTVCYKKSALWVFPKPADVKVIKGSLSELTDYKFNTGKYTHKFCPTCGVSLLVQGYVTPLKPGEDRLPDNGINVRTFQHGQVDPWTLDLKTFDGKNHYPSTHEGPKFTGTEPTVEVKDGRLYKGGCHCGAVTVAMKVKPIDKDTEGLLECNCSACARYGATWDYQPHGQIVIDGREKLSSYAFRQKIAVKKFCKICGVAICSEPADNITAEDEAAMDEATRGWWEKSKLVKAINLRLLDDLDVKVLSPTRFDGFNYIQPRYEEP